MLSELSLLRKEIKELKDKISQLEKRIDSEQQAPATTLKMSNASETSRILTTPLRYQPPTTSPIPQIDGNVEDFRASFNRDVVIGGDLDECWFCDNFEEVVTVEDYINHLQKCGGICVNCLDYFTDRPWFHPDLLDDKT